MTPRTILLSCLALLVSCRLLRVQTTLPDAPSRLPAIQTVRATPDLRSNTEYAITWWNAELGRTALRYTDGPADILVVHGEAHPNGSLASADPQTGMVYIHAPLDTYRSIRHELGHAAFWLAHDPQQPESVMYPTLAFDYGQVADPLKQKRWPARDPRFFLMPEDRDAIECRLGQRTTIRSARGEVPCG